MFVWLHAASLFYYLKYQSEDSLSISGLCWCMLCLRLWLSEDTYLELTCSLRQTYQQHFGIWATMHPTGPTTDDQSFCLWRPGCDICMYSPDSSLGELESVCKGMPRAQMQWTVLISGTGGEPCASDGSGLVNNLEGKSLDSRSPEEVRRSLQREPRDRTDSHFTAAQKLWNEMNLEVSPRSKKCSWHKFLYTYPAQKYHRGFWVFEWAWWLGEMEIRLPKERLSIIFFQWLRSSFICQPSMHLWPLLWAAKRFSQIITLQELWVFADKRRISQSLFK